MPNPFPSRPRRPEAQNIARPKHKSKPNPKSKSKYKTKQTRATKSRNWRSRSPTPSATLSHMEGGGYFECDCGCTSYGYAYAYEWSEESIQRQLSYLVPVPYTTSTPDASFDEIVSWDASSDELGSSGRGPCCWHHGLGWGGGSVVWCCGGVCVFIGGGVGGSPGAFDEDDGLVLVLGLVDEGNASGWGCEVEEQLDMVQMKEGEAGEMLCRDEWDCQFCGLECFCRYQEFSEQIREEEYRDWGI